MPRPLTYAVKNGHINAVRLLLNHKTNMNYIETGFNRDIPLIGYAQDDIDMIRLLLEYGADPHLHTCCYPTPIIVRYAHHAFIKAYNTPSKGRYSVIRPCDRCAKYALDGWSDID